MMLDALATDVSCNFLMRLSIWTGWVGIHNGQLDLTYVTAAYKPCTMDCVLINYLFQSYGLHHPTFSS